MKTCKQNDSNSSYPPNTPDSPPSGKPSFTLKDLRDAIPPHCFKRSLPTSLGHLLKNLLICGFLFYLSTFITPNLWFLWPVYWFLQGVYMLGLWVLAHECGHRAFSDYALIDDTVGFLVHSFLLVPFQSWRQSHKMHHLNTGNCEHDQVFVPPTRSSIQSTIVEMLEESPIYNSISLVLMLTTGLMPAYLFENFGGPLKYKHKNVNHFVPSAEIFLPKQWNEILLADFGVITVFMGLSIVSMTYGFNTVLVHYGLPYLLTNCFVVLITFLHHTDTFVPHFRDSEWTWLRGALCTVDRSYGSWLDNTFHHIADTHVCHHLFPSMPFYHTVEATKAITKVLGKYHLKDETPILRALFRAHSNCKFIEDEEEIAFYKRNLRQI